MKGGDLNFIISDIMKLRREGRMNKKKLIGWGLCVITVFVFTISMFIAELVAGRRETGA